MELGDGVVRGDVSVTAGAVSVMVGVVVVVTGGAVSGMVGLVVVVTEGAVSVMMRVGVVVTVRRRSVEAICVGAAIPLLLIVLAPSQHLHQ